MFQSCTKYSYYRENPTQTSGIDFSKGKWILGNISVNPSFHDEITKLAFEDFSKHLKTRLINVANDRTLLISTVVPLKPSKSKIQDLNKGTNCDYFINIKCENHRNKGNQFDTSDKTYYEKQLTFARVSLEVYDLNQGTIIFSQTIGRVYDENIGMGLSPVRTLIFGCYSKIIDDINKKSI
jgi:hypothetical protein